MRFSFGKLDLRNDSSRTKRECDSRTKPAFNPQEIVFNDDYGGAGAMNRPLAFQGLLLRPFPLQRYKLQTELWSRSVGVQRIEFEGSTASGRHAAAEQ